MKYPTGSALNLPSPCSSSPDWAGTLGGGGWVTLIDSLKEFDNFVRLGDANRRAADDAIVAHKGKEGLSGNEGRL